MNLIAAVDEKWGIAKDGGLLANLPGDMKYFREKTTGKIVVMGRSTLESLPGKKPLPKRINVVLTRQPDYEADGAIIVHDMEELMYEVNKYVPDEVMIMGGASVYNELVEQCDTLYITKIYHDFDADKRIKNIDEMKQFKVAWKSEMMEENGYSYQFFEYKRKRVK